MLTACGRRFARMLTRLGRRSTWRWLRKRCLPPFSRKTVLLRRAPRKWWLTPFPDITRSDAGAVNLAVTSAAVERIIADTRERRRKAIIFVTGVPGAGKTLVGLNVATRHGSRDDAAHAVFLSGNGPLVSVLREALARDELDRRKKAHEEKVPAPIFTQD